MATIRLLSEWKEFFNILNSEKVEYVVIGGIAVNYHGYTRTTADIDIWINHTAENAQRISTALQRFGFSTASVEPSQFEHPHAVFTMGIAPNRIDLLTFAAGLNFADANARVLDVIIDETPMRMIHRDDLLENKRQAGRLKDLADLEELNKKRRKV